MSFRLSRAEVHGILDPGPGVSDLSLDRDAMWSCYREVRRTTEALCAPLETEDYVVQSMPDASPAKWHLAHTSWFFETFILLPESARATRPSTRDIAFLFNSYYNAVGERIARDRARPALAADGGRGLPLPRGRSIGGWPTSWTGSTSPRSTGSGPRSSSGCITSSSTRS